ncbi:hypothetical protein [Patulibacter minatonensis]|uniref:hypothetical protein n=1 Tax=Patulibacter minatonensis TaxID=298163 RepID=UPI00047C5FFB|nr:hypothetical protein [Patulibacter minatonensis]
MNDEHAFCPHCRQLLQKDAPRPFPTRPMRCPGCLLQVGPGRARDAGGRSRRTGARATGGVPQDAVLGVLRDVQLQALDVEVHADVVPGR